MDKKDQELLDKYIGRLLELKDAKQSQLSEEELQQVALEIGMTEADLRMAREVVRSHIKRGKTYQDTGNWEQAEAEYSQAVELDPLSAKTQYELASFYYARWQKLGTGKEQLDQALQQCLALTPDFSPAKKLLLDIGKTKRGKRTKRKAKMIFWGIFTPIFLFVGYFVLKEAEIIPPTRTGLEGMEYQVPTEIVTDPNAEGVTMEITKFIVKHDDDTFIDINYFSNTIIHCLLPLP